MPIAKTPPRDAAELAAPPVTWAIEDVAEVELLAVVLVDRVGAAVVDAAAEDEETTTAAEVDVALVVGAALVEDAGVLVAADVVEELARAAAQSASAAGRTSSGEWMLVNVHQ